MEKNSERRLSERFDLALPCLLSLYQDGVYSDLIELKTRNIGAGGALLAPVRQTSFSVAANVEIILPPNLIKCAEGSGTHISVSGSVLRSEPDGIAISFCEEYQIAPLDEVLCFIKKKIEWMERQRCLICSDAAPNNLLHFSLRMNAHRYETLRMEKV